MPGMNAIEDLLTHARHPDDLDTLVIAGVIGIAVEGKRSPLIRGLSDSRFQKLVNEFFTDIALSNGGSGEPGNDDEFQELLDLLIDSRTEPTEKSAWLAHAVATAAMGENHLWQDMGLPSRRHLSDFLRLRFAPLAALNTGDMKWKKFFYRQLCQRAGVPICKSPHCADCVDHPICFGAEEGPAP